MGNLNQFYLMGRVVGSPRIIEAERGPIAEIALTPGSAGRGRGGSPLRFQAAGPQFEPGKALKEGDAVLLRGQLRNEPVEGSDEGRLIAWVQAIEHLAGSSGGGGGGGGESGSRPRRKRRRRGGGRKEGGREKQGGEGDSAQGDSARGGQPPQSDRAKADAATQQLPPPKPVAEAPQSAPAPDPSYSKDMPF